MKVVVSTLNNSKNNYGALFQSCALGSFLTKMNCDVSYITIGERVRKKHKCHINFVFVKKIVKNICLLPHVKDMKNREQKFIRFASETQNRIVYHTQEDLFQNPPIADMYLSGSDQVWNPIAMIEDLFLAYAPKDAKKISYAASMGNEVIPKENLERFSQLVGEYSAISVREDTMIDIIKSYTDKPVYQHIDPVFLKTRAEWEQLEAPYKKLKYNKFILAYVIEWNAEFDRRLAELKKKSGLPVVSVNLGNIKKVCADQVIYDASPNEFLYLLHHSEYVVATSFHGVAMSIVYNKPFMPLAGTNMPTRIESLLRHFGIDALDSVNYGKKEFDKINSIIIQDQIAAREYIESLIK